MNSIYHVTFRPHTVGERCGYHTSSFWVYVELLVHLLRGRAVTVVL